MRTLGIRTGLRASLGGFAADRSASTAIEYSLIATLVGVALVSALLLLGQDLSAKFATVTSYFPQ